MHPSLLCFLISFHSILLCFTLWAILGLFYGFGKRKENTPLSREFALIVEAICNILTESFMWELNRVPWTQRESLPVIWQELWCLWVGCVAAVSIWKITGYSKNKHMRRAAALIPIVPYTALSCSCSWCSSLRLSKLHTNILVNNAKTTSGSDLFQQRIPIPDWFPARKNHFPIWNYNLTSDLPVYIEPDHARISQSWSHAQRYTNFPPYGWRLLLVWIVLTCDTLAAIIMIAMT